MCGSVKVSTLCITCLKNLSCWVLQLWRWYSWCQTVVVVLPQIYVFVKIHFLLKHITWSAQDIFGLKTTNELGAAVLVVHSHWSNTFLLYFQLFLGLCKLLHRLWILSSSNFICEHCQKCPRSNVKQMRGSMEPRGKPANVWSVGDLRDPNLVRNDSIQLRRLRK